MRKGAARTGSRVAGAGAAAERLKGLQPGVTKALVAGEGTGSLSSAVLRCAEVLLKSHLDACERSGCGADAVWYGRYDCGGAQGWFWGTWKVDVPLFDLLGRESSLKRLAELVEKKLSEHREDQQ